MYELALCTGIGGLSLGLQRAGIQTACYIERDDYRINVLIQRMQDGWLDPAPIWDDVTSFDGTPWRGRIHIISAGFPCQPFSLAGGRRGEDDERYIWSSIYRIICEVQPWYVLQENVPGLLMAKRDEPAPVSPILGDLAQQGYDAEWVELSAAAFDAPHLRKRFFLVAHSNQERRIRIFQDNLSGSYRLYPLWQASEKVVLLQDRLRHLEGMLSEPSVFGDDDGLPYRVERLAAVGEAVVPQVAEYIGRCILRMHVSREEQT